jgi:hypothetical protein
MFAMRELIVFIHIGKGIERRMWECRNLGYTEQL